MAWPEHWVPVSDTETAAALARELDRELGRGHALKGVPVRAIGRDVRRDDVLFAFDDGTGRVAEVHLTWARHPEPPPWPDAVIYANFEEWARVAP